MRRLPAARLIVGEDIAYTATRACGDSLEPFLLLVQSDSGRRRVKLGRSSARKRRVA
jgi:hypothetical protein